MNSSKLSFAATLLFSSLFLSEYVLAEKCEDEIDHLKDFGVYYYSKLSEKRNLNFYIYKDIPNTTATIAIPKSDAEGWKIDIAPLAKGGHTFTARGMIVGITGVFDKNGKCINSSAFEYDVLGGELPSNTENMFLYFNYNYQVCQKVEKIVNKYKLKIDFDSINTVSDEIKKHKAEHKQLKQLTILASKNKFYKITPPDIGTLILKCITQIENRKVQNVPVKKSEKSNAIR